MQEKLENNIYSLFFVCFLLKHHIAFVGARLAGYLIQERLFNPNLDVEILDKTNKTWMSSSEWVVDYS